MLDSLKCIGHFYIFIYELIFLFHGRPIHLINLFLHPLMHYILPLIIFLYMWNKKYKLIYYALLAFYYNMEARLLFLIICHLIQKVCINDCVICLENIIFYKVTLKCRHSYHKHCLNEWLKRQSTCPLCRNDVDLPGDDDNYWVNV